MDFVQIEADNVIGIKIDGKIVKPDLEKVFTVVEEKLATHPKLRIYVEVESFEGISLDALIADLKFALPKMNKFERKAVVSDQGWMKPIIEVGDKLFPSIDVKLFTRAERDAALAWVAE